MHLNQVLLENQGKYLHDNFISIDRKILMNAFVQGKVRGHKLVGEIPTGTTNRAKSSGDTLTYI